MTSNSSSKIHGRGPRRAVAGRPRVPREAGRRGRGGAEGSQASCGGGRREGCRAGQEAGRHQLTTRRVERGDPRQSGASRRRGRPQSRQGGGCPPRLPGSGAATPERGPPASRSRRPDGRRALGERSPSRHQAGPAGVGGRQGPERDSAALVRARPSDEKRSEPDHPTRPRRRGRGVREETGELDAELDALGSALARRPIWCASSRWGQGHITLTNEHSNSEEKT